MKSPEQIIKDKKIEGFINLDFQWSEFFKESCSDIEIFKNIQKVAYVLSVYKHKLFDSQPITITSGYRSPEHQIEVYRQKGITDLSKIPMGSYHLKGLAADFTVKGFTISQLYRLMDIHHWGGVERTDGNWQHIDLRNKNVRFTSANIILQPHYNLEAHNRIFH